MKRFVEGEDRQQATLLPACLDDYVTEDNPVRVIDVFIDELVSRDDRRAARSPPAQASHQCTHLPPLSLPYRQSPACQFKA